MAESGEELVGAWLRMIGGCDFVQYNVPLKQKQGEIDVIGINLATQTAYVCEVATHLGGLQYVKDNQPDNINRLTTKFCSDVEFARRYLHDFSHCFMLWSPVVVYPKSGTVKHNQFTDLAAIRRNIWESCEVEVEMVINEIYLARVNELRSLALQETAASEYPVFRLLQIITHLEAHVERLQARGINSLEVIGITP